MSAHGGLRSIYMNFSVVAMTLHFPGHYDGRWFWEPNGNPDANQSGIE